MFRFFGKMFKRGESAGVSTTTASSRSVGSAGEGNETQAREGDADRNSSGGPKPELTERPAELAGGAAGSWQKRNSCMSNDSPTSPQQFSRHNLLESVARLQMTRAALSHYITNGARRQNPPFAGCFVRVLVQRAYKQPGYAAARIVRVDRNGDPYPYTSDQKMQTTVHLVLSLPFELVARNCKSFQLTSVSNKALLPEEMEEWLEGREGMNGLELRDRIASLDVSLDLKRFQPQRNTVATDQRATIPAGGYSVPLATATGGKSAGSGSTRRASDEDGQRGSGRCGTSEKSRESPDPLVGPGSGREEGTNDGGGPFLAAPGSQSCLMSSNRTMTASLDEVETVDSQADQKTSDGVQSDQKNTDEAMSVDPEEKPSVASHSDPCSA